MHSDLGKFSTLLSRLKCPCLWWSIAICWVDNNYLLFISSTETSAKSKGRQFQSTVRRRERFTERRRLIQKFHLRHKFCEALLETAAIEVIRSVSCCLVLFRSFSFRNCSRSPAIRLRLVCQSNCLFYCQMGPCLLLSKSSAVCLSVWRQLEPENLFGRREIRPFVKTMLLLWGRKRKLQIGLEFSTNSQLLRRSKSLAERISWGAFLAVQWPRVSCQRPGQQRDWASNLWPRCFGKVRNVFVLYSPHCNNRLQESKMTIVRPFYDSLLPVFLLSL